MTPMQTDRPLRLLIIQTVPFTSNGITSFVMNYCRQIDPARITVDIVLPNAPAERVQQEIADNGGQIFVLPQRNHNPLAYSAALQAIVRNNGYDIVHAHGNSATLYVEMRAAKRGGAKVRISHSHNTTCKQKRIDQLLRPFFYRSFTHALACGQAAGDWLYPNRPFTVINNAIDTKAFSFNPAARARIRREAGWQDALVLCHVGTFNKQKNHACLIDIFTEIHRRHQAARLMLIGEGPLKNAIERMVDQRGLGDSVWFVGKIEHSAAYLSAADAFLLPSLFEGLPFTLLEAQCAGLPCYVSDRITKDAFLTDTITPLPLADAPDCWAQAVLSAGVCTDRDRTAASEQGAAALGNAGCDIVKNAEFLMSFYENSVRLKTLFLVTHKMSGGGCERVIAQLLNRFSQQGIACTLITECDVPSFYVLDKRIRQIPLLASAGMRAGDVPKVYGKLRSLVKTERPDLILAMPEKVNVWTVLCLRGTGVPVVVSERNDPRRHPENRIKRALRTLIYPFADGFVFQTQQAADCFSRKIRARGVVLPNPLDTSALPSPTIDHRKTTVVSAGRLHAQKNFPLLIAAFTAFYKTHPSWRLIVYGEGNERDTLERMISTLPKDAVTLPGQVSELPTKIADCGVFVLTSDYEGMPNVLIEAMAMGCACVATDCPVGGCAALIRDGENGLLVPIGDEVGLTNALCKIADNATLAHTLGENAIKVRDTLDERIIVEKWRQYLDRIAAK